MFTFSFGSAFATVSWTGEATSKYLTEAGDYDLNGETVSTTATKGTEGITEAYRAELTARAKAELKHVKNAGVFYAPEKAEAVAAIEAYIESLKTVKTAKDAEKLTKDLAKVVGTWHLKGDTASITVNTLDKDGELKQKEAVRTDALPKLAAAKKSDNTNAAVIDLTRIADRAGSDALYLPGYATFTSANIDATVTTEKTLKIDTKKDASAIFANYPTGDTSDDKLVKAVIDWFLDNDYRETTEFSTGAKAFMNALTIVDDDYAKAVKTEKQAITDEIWKYADKADDARKPLPASDAEGIDAVVKKINDIDKKYAGLVIDSKEIAFDDAAKDFLKKAITGAKGIVANYFGQYEDELTALPAAKKMTDADKAKVQELYKKVNALLDSYEDTWEFVSIEDISEDLTYNYNVLKEGLEKFLKDDVKAFNNLDKFEVISKGKVDNGNQLYYFDASEKNVNALKAKRTAYDALVAGYGYSKLNSTTSGLNYAAAATAEAEILAAEHNQGADAAYDVKDTKKLQAYLNNATLKVTTKALGNNKIRVNARFDAETYKDIVAECGNDYTISYKFYQKTAKATSFKGPKEKSRNYITYTKASLKKGTKYKFQCGVVIKDAQGNVVAEKNYRASTTGSRICR